MTEISVKPIPMMPSNLPAAKASPGSSVASANVWSTTDRPATSTVSLKVQELTQWSVELAGNIIFLAYMDERTVIVSRSGDFKLQVFRLSGML